VRTLLVAEFAARQALENAATDLGIVNADVHERWAPEDEASIGKIHRDCRRQGIEALEQFERSLVFSGR
jgi:deoxyribodipyrimidine photolyase